MGQSIVRAHHAAKSFRLLLRSEMRSGFEIKQSRIQTTEEQQWVDDGSDDHSVLAHYRWSRGALLLHLLESINNSFDARGNFQKWTRQISFFVVLDLAVNTAIGVESFLQRSGHHESAVEARKLSALARQRH